MSTTQHNTKKLYLKIGGEACHENSVPNRCFEQDFLEGI